MIRHKYNYLVETIDGNGEITTYETAKNGRRKLKRAGGIDKFEERRSLRYTSKYIWPIITGPIARLNQTRLEWQMHIGLSILAPNARHARCPAGMHVPCRNR